VKESPLVGHAVLPSEDLQAALVQALGQSKVFRTIGANSADWELTVSVAKIIEPETSLDMSASVFLDWLLTKSGSGAIAWNETIGTSHTATTFDADFAEERRLIAMQTAVREQKVMVSASPGGALSALLRYDPATMNEHGGLRSARSRLAEMFAIDLRSLAVFRVALGALLLVDLGLRAPLIGTNYTDAGVMPRALLPRLPTLSLHALSGGPELQVVLFLLAAAFAALLLVGFFTRVATAASWLLLLSLHYRNPALLDGGDLLVRQLLMWSLFLPLGERWSIDARRRGVPADRTSVLSAASVALLLQFFFFYVSTGFSKSGPEWHADHTALQMALAQTYWSRPFGQSLLEYPGLLRASTVGVVSFESYAPFLLLVPWFLGPIRVLLVVGFVGLMVGLGITIQLNLFPFDGILVVLPLLPTWFWERVLLVPAGDAPRRRTRRSEWLAALVVIPLLLHATYLNLATHGKVEPPPWLLEAAVPLGIHQSWTMYGPSPPDYDLDFRVVGSLRRGRPPVLVDTETDEAWPPLRAMHADYRFKYFLERLIRPDGRQDSGPRVQGYLSGCAAGGTRRTTSEAALPLSASTSDRRTSIRNRKPSSPRNSCSDA
jgi:hypothetical protein